MARQYVDIIQKQSRPYIESLRDDMKLRKSKTFFWPTGTQVYVGRQGSGKTISAVKHLIDLKKRYPKAIIVSNLDLSYYKAHRIISKSTLELQVEHVKKNSTTDYLQFKTMEQLAIALVNVNNAYFGVIYIIDEIHTYFNALDSKNVPMYVFTEISQQRKQRKLIIGTSQLFLRMAKPLREQADNLIMCKTIFGIFTITKAYDGMTLDQDFDGKISGDKKKTGWFFHTREIRKAFNTFQKVVSGAEQYEAVQRVEMVDKSKKRKLFKK